MSGQGASLHELAPKYLRNRHRILFYTVLLTLVSAPILSALEFNGILIESFLAANLLAAARRDLVPAIFWAMCRSSLRSPSAVLPKSRRSLLR